MNSMHLLKVSVSLIVLVIGFNAYEFVSDISSVFKCIPDMLFHIALLFKLNLYCNTL